MGVTVMAKSDGVLVVVGVELERSPMGLIGALRLHLQLGFNSLGNLKKKKKKKKKKHVISVRGQRSAC